MTLTQFMFNALVAKHWRRFQRETGCRAHPQPQGEMNLFRPAENDLESALWETCCCLYQVSGLTVVLQYYLSSPRRVKDIALLHRSCTSLLRRRPHLLPGLLWTLGIQLDQPLLFWPQLIPLALAVETGRITLEEILSWQRPQLVSPTSPVS